MLSASTYTLYLRLVAVNFLRAVPLAISIGLTSVTGQAVNALPSQQTSIFLAHSPPAQVDNSKDKTSNSNQDTESMLSSIVKLHIYVIILSLDVIVIFSIFNYLRRRFLWLEEICSSNIARISNIANLFSSKSKQSKIGSDSSSQLIDQDKFEDIFSLDELNREQIEKLLNDIVNKAVTLESENYLKELEKTKSSFNGFLEDLLKGLLPVIMADEISQVYSKINQELNEGLAPYKDFINDPERLNKEKEIERLRIDLDNIGQNLPTVKGIAEIVIKELSKAIDTKLTGLKSEIYNDLDELKKESIQRDKVLEDKINRSLESNQQSKRLIQDIHDNLYGKNKTQRPNESILSDSEHGKHNNSGTQPDEKLTRTTSYSLEKVQINDLDRAVREIVKIFNESANTFTYSYRNIYVTVSEDKETNVNRITGQGNKPILFQKHDAGSFVALPEIINDSHVNAEIYWLFPKPDSTPGEYNTGVWKILFGYQDQDFSRYKIIYPAKLQIVSERTRFQLLASGEIEFI